ncbi:hypothetical protein PGB90_001805 [Kerria lacca]
MEFTTRLGLHSQATRLLGAALPSNVRDRYGPGTLYGSLPRSRGTWIAVPVRARYPPLLARKNITHANKTLCCFVPSRFPLLPCASVVVIKKSSRPSLLLLLFFPLKCSGRNDGQKTDYNDDAGASGVDEDDRARVAQDSLVTRAAMCVRLVDVRITCGLHDDAQLAAVFIDPRANRCDLLRSPGDALTSSPTENLVTTFTSSKRPSSVIFPTVQIGSKAAAPRSEDLTAVVQSVVATGGVYKGQGRNQRELMTRAYWEFLVHGEQLQAPIPSTKEVQRVARYKPLGPGINLHADSFSVARVRPRTSKGITDLLSLSLVRLC